MQRSRGCVRTLEADWRTTTRPRSPDGREQSRTSSAPHPSTRNASSQHASRGTPFGRHPVAHRTSEGSRFPAGAHFVWTARSRVRQPGQSPRGHRIQSWAAADSPTPIPGLARAPPRKVDDPAHDTPTPAEPAPPIPELIPFRPRLHTLPAPHANSSGLPARRAHESFMPRLCHGARALKAAWLHLYIAAGDEMVSANPLGSVTSNARVPHSVSWGRISISMRQSSVAHHRRRRRSPHPRHRFRQGPPRGSSTPSPLLRHDQPAHRYRRFFGARAAAAWKDFSARSASAGRPSLR